MNYSLFNYYDINDSYENKLSLIKAFIKWLKNKTNDDFNIEPIRKYEINYSDKIVNDIIKNGLHKNNTNLNSYLLYMYFYNYVYNEDFQNLYVELNVNDNLAYHSLLGSCIERSINRIIRKHDLVENMFNYNMYDDDQCGERVKPPYEDYPDTMVSEAIDDFVFNIKYYISCYKDTIIKNPKSFLDDIILELSNMYHGTNSTSVWIDILGGVIEEVNGMYDVKFDINDYL